MHPTLAFVLSAMAGHLFGYEAALAIDAQARPLREARGAIEAAVGRTGGGADGDDLLDRPAARRSSRSAAGFFDGLRAGAYDGHLEAGTAVRLASLFRYASGIAPLDAYQIEYGKVGTPSVVIDDLTAALTGGIEELTRPVDAIKHQAKTVTVGISRSDETLLQVPLVQEVLAAGAARDRLSYKALRTLADLDPASRRSSATPATASTGGVDAPARPRSPWSSTGAASPATCQLRTDEQPACCGAPSTAWRTEREVTVAVGRSDGRTLVIVPEVKDNSRTGLTLLHVPLRATGCRRRRCARCCRATATATTP